MNTQVTKLIMSLLGYVSKLNPVLAYYLDKLKIRKPVVYIITQISLLVVLGLFYMNLINITDEIDTAIIGIITLLVGGVSSSTYNYKQEYKQEYKSKPKESVEALKQRAGQPIEDDTFPTVDQSNN